MVLATCRVCIVQDHGQSVARSLGELDITLDDGLEHQFLEVALHLVVDLVGQAQTTVEHRQQETFDLQVRVQLVFDDLDGVEQLADTLQCKVFALYGDDHGVGSRQGIDGDEAQGGGTVNQDIVVLLADGIEQLLDDLLTVIQVQHLNLRTYQVDVTGDDVQPFYVCRVYGFVYVGLVDDTFVE